MFYKDPVPLNPDTHGSWRLLPERMNFVADTNALPIVAGEFVSIAQFYPIVFTVNDGAPLAAVGLRQHNLFVNDGKWDAGAYVPAYVRRYPFVFMQVPQEDNFLLAIDAASDQINRGGSADGVALFEDGKPTDLVNNALRFCGEYTQEFERTQQFCKALREQDLLVDRRVDATTPDGRAMAAQGFQAVDVEKFSKLPDDIVIAWHRNGYLALIHHHLSSLARFGALVEREGARPA